VAITTAVLPEAAVGSAYHLTLTAAGGTGCCTWSAVGSLPPGLTLSADGVLSGTPTTAGTFVLEVRALATGPVVPEPPGPPYADLLPFPSLRPFFDYVLQALGLTPAPSGRPVPLPLNEAISRLRLTVVPAVQVDTTSLQAAQVDVPYFAGLSAQGGTGSGAFLWSLSGGTLPPGLTLSPTGLLGGTPTQVGSYTFSAEAADAALPDFPSPPQSLTLRVLPPGLQPTTFLLGDGTVQQPYAQQGRPPGGPHRTRGPSCAVASRPGSPWTPTPAASMGSHRRRGPTPSRSR